MRKLAIFVVTAFVLALAATAYAAQVNKYEITGKTSPRTAGSKKKPKAIGISFGFKVKEESGQRPAVVHKYAITFAGTRVNKSAASTCSLGTLEDEGVKGCSKKSIVGTGFIENKTGNTADPTDTSILCNAALTVVNLKGSKAAIYVEGDPNQTDRRRKCAIQLAAPIPATFKNTKSGSTLTFTVPSSLRHPGAPTISNAVVSVTSKIKKITRKRKGKRVGFYEAVGCKKGKRKVSVKFTTEAGDSKTASKNVRC